MCVGSAAPTVSAKAAVLMVAETGEVLYKVNPDLHLPMASTTKIMTSLLAIEACTPMRVIKVTDEMVNIEGTSMGLLPGDLVTLRALVTGMLLQSGNDAAHTVACVLGGTQEEFAKLMNARARQIGMHNTNFVTASGLDAKGHYSSAYDMALLAREAIKNPEFRSICSQKYARLCYGNPPYMRTLTNHNRLLWCYKDAIGIKTGFTKKSRRCLVSAAERDGVLLVAVTLNDSDDWNDHIKLYEYGFSKVTGVPLDGDLSGVSLKVVGGNKSAALVKLVGQPKAGFIGEVPTIERQVHMRAFEYAPIKEGDIVGYVRYYSNGSLICENAIIAGETVETFVPPVPQKPQETPGLFKRMYNKIKNFVSNLR